MKKELPVALLLLLLLAAAFSPLKAAAAATIGDDVNDDDDGSCAAIVNAEDTPAVVSAFVVQSSNSSSCDACDLAVIIPFLDWTADKLSISSTALEAGSFLALVLLLQLGIIPSVYRADGTSISPCGSFMWCGWMGCVLFQFLTTFMSLLCLVLGTMSVLYYDDCLAPAVGNEDAAAGAAGAWISDGAGGPWLLFVVAIASDRRLPGLMV